MAEESAMKFFLLSVLFSLCSAASFYVIENVDNSRIKRAATTTVDPSLIDGQDIAGIRDGSDILTKDTNPIPGGADSLKATGIDGSDIAGVRDGSDILTKDTNQGLTVDGRDIAGVRDGSDILTKDTNQGLTVDGRDIAGVRDGSDILTKDTKPGLTVDGRDIAGVRDGSDILTKDTKPGLTVDGRDIAGVRDGSDILTKDTKPGLTVDGRDIAGVRDGSDILTKDTNQGQNPEATTAEQPAHQAAESSDHPSTTDTVTDSPSYSNHHGYQYNHHRNMFQYYQQYHETTTHDPEYETTTHDPEHETTTAPEPVHFDNTGGWHNPLHMSRPGELPPMALPMTSDFVDKPIALPLTAEVGDKPMALPLTAESSHQIHHGAEASQNSQSGTDSLHNPENPLYMSHDWFPSTGETNVMPQALPLTGHLDAQENTAPIALAQKGISPSSTEKRGGKGRQFPGRGKQRPGARPSAPPGGRKPGPGRAVKEPGPRGGGQPRPPPNWGAPGQKAAPGTAFGAPAATPAPPSPSAGTVAGAEAGPGATGGGEEAAGAGGNDFMRNLMAMNMMRSGGGGDMFSEMMEMQRRMMRNNPQMLQQQMNMYQQMYQQMYPQLFGGSQGSGGEGGGEAAEGGSAMSQMMPMMQGMPMYGMGMGEEGGNEMAMAMANGMNLNFQSPFMQGQLCQTNPDTPICRLMSQQANMTAMMAASPMAGLPMGGLPMGMGETQIEGPFGEMDMEPGEMDIEGPIAHQLLMQSSLIPQNRAQQTTHPMHNEITLNHHVLKALQSRFGVNTTQGIQQMATNPEFQAFMFQVLRQSQQSAPGEYHANLSAAQVNQILAGLNSSTSGNDRVPPGNLNDATLQERPHVRGGPPSSNQAVLTLDSPLAQQQASLAQPGTFQALVQKVMGTSTPAPTAETAEKTKAASEETTSANNETVAPTKKTVGAETAAVLLGLGTPKEATGFGSPSGQGVAGLGQQNQLLSTLSGMDGMGQNGQQNQLLTALGGNDGFGQTVQENQLLGMPWGNTGMGQGMTGQNQLTGMAGGAVVTKKGNNEIRNKDEIPGLSQDARNRAFGKVDKNKFGKTAGAGGINAGVTVDNRPIGLQEAGLFPGANDTVPVEKIQPSYSSSTVFAIAAIVLIAIIIVIGPIFCALCKMREKREEQRRKMKALKNREVSENNIMEAMMLHEFGSSGTNSVSNEAAMSPNYYTNEQTRYDTVDPEIECLNQSQPLP